MHVAMGRKQKATGQEGGKKKRQGGSSRCGTSDRELELFFPQHGEFGALALCMRAAPRSLVFVCILSFATWKAWPNEMRERCVTIIFPSPTLHELSAGHGAHLLSTIASSLLGLCRGKSRALDWCPSLAGDVIISTFT